MPEPVYKKIADLTASSDVQDSDQAEIQRGIAGYSITFLTVWNWIKTKISNWSTVLQYLGDSGGKLTYKGNPVVAVNGTDKELMFNDATTQSTVTGLTWDKTLKILGMLVTTKIRRYLITTPAALFTGTATTGSTTTVINTSFDSTTLANKALIFTSGLNKSQCRKIITANATSVTVSPAFANAPTNGDTIEAIDVTTVLAENMSAVWGFNVTNNHAVILPQITTQFDGSWNVYFAKTVTSGKELHLLPNPADTVDGISQDVLLIESRETVTQFASFATNMWLTLATENLSAVATITSVDNFDVLTDTTTFRPIEGGNGGIDHTPVQLLRFIQPVGQEYKLQYTSTIPRKLLFGANINLSGISNQIQIATIRVMKYTKATGLTAEIISSRRSITLSSTNDTQQIIITSNQSFSLGDQIWIETANNSGSYTYRIIKSTLDIR